MSEQFQTLADVLARDRRSDRLAHLHAPSGRSYDYRRFLTTAWKSGLFFRNEGVRGGMAVAIAGDPIPETVLSFLGAGLLGATVEFEPDTLSEGTKALVAPTGRIREFDTGPGTRLVGYGAEPDDPSVSYWERDVWSENPTLPPDRVAPEDPLLRTDGVTYGHADLLEAATAVATEYGLDADDEVVIRTPLTDAGTVVGLLVPLVAGATLVVPDGETTGTLGIGDGPDDATMLPADIW
ncbi:acetyl-CoA synthetase [Halosegnis rubeus]|jgi:hypothetical protein|uniref:Acetyl-CoA synthetase n=1 Tax=Halosegnis rubeus TaxID=2212850 RepID=A0A5N5UM09_9EURY|nr:acetyl-CoA synthetase [Halosegnis rubeus]KAB7514770.1 acetyl-CoA synthetase [Halosegnis rubeus]KAB7518081.1 acetyl-CoA synthetase [Halosegnis rubeus]KAB7519344.1 acetyl-CoA synthetase [Halosegnis rubeus]